MRGIAAYLGGKSRLVSTIVPKIPNDITCYAEVFAGAGNVFFGREENTEVEVINDISKDLITLYRVVKHHLDEFVRHLRWCLVSRDEFSRLLKENPETLTDIQRAIRYFYLLKTSFGGKVTGQAFGVSAVQKPSFNLLRIEEDLSNIHLRLSRTMIENLPYNKLIERYDRPGTFFYADPPYWNGENDYGKDIFSKEDFTQLRDQFSNIEGRFLMSINDAPEIRTIFKDFKIEEVKTKYSVQKNKNSNVTELLIMNY